jgi:hypothetical protein
MVHWVQSQVGWVVVALALGLGLGCGLGSSSLHAASPPVPESAARDHWAFHPVQRPAIPTAPEGVPPASNPIDAFVRSALAARHLAPAPPADRATLIRRAYLDVLGLPPTPEEVRAFQADSTPGAFTRVVDRLLASPHYGERWARHWLDLARYAESEGFKLDETRPNAWRYRDYVVQSLNDDKPYDRFVQEQIAGDELWPEDSAARIATGFNRHYADESNARNLRHRRQEILNDITDTVGGVFLGMTYACARCHDHKFDPILQADYYRLQAYFANTAAKDDIPVVSREEVARHATAEQRWEEATREIRAALEALEAPRRREIEKDFVDKYPDEIQAALRKPETERTPFERQMAWKARQYLDPRSREYIANDEAVKGKIAAADKPRWQQLRKQLEDFKLLRPAPLPIASAMVDLEGPPPATHILFKGAPDRPLDPVTASLPRILNLSPRGIRRSDLARSLTDPANPLVARVMVNRIWQHHFGRGLVGTPSDFGLKGDRPTHPELLDWLAAELVSGGWSLKHIHRLILTSATYRQSSLEREEPARIDPSNRLLWKYPRHRLEGEVIRDASLAAAGLLNLKAGGPGVFPPLPAGMPAPRGGWPVEKEVSERNRRSLYIFVRRNTRYPLFDTFDMPDAHESCPERNRTTSPLQALALLNGEASLEWSRGFAHRVLADARGNARAAIDRAWRIAYGRAPESAERHSATEFLARQRALFLREQPGTGSAAEEDPQTRAMTDLCHALLNSNEFLHID